MKKAPEFFDPQIPATLRYLAEGTKAPGNAAKAVVFGLIRRIENTLSAIAGHAIRTSRSVMEKAVDQVSSAVANALAKAATAAILYHAALLPPFASALPDSLSWLPPLIEYLEQFQHLLG